MRCIMPRSKETTTMEELPDSVSGYSWKEDFVAQQTLQGNRITYLISLPIHRVCEILPRPDPNREFEDNRIVDLTRAKRFAKYVRECEGWTAGVLQVRSDSQTCVFNSMKDYGVLRLGTIEVPAGNRGSFFILDGQHRILGFHLAIEELDAERTERNRQLQKAIRAGNPKSEIAKRQKGLEELERQRERFFKESIGIQIVIEGSNVEARKMFSSINDNQKGVQRSVTSRFNRERVADRALQRMIEEGPVHVLLVDRVDNQKDRVVGSNPHLLSAGKLSDLIRFVHRGIYGRYSDEMNADIGLDEALVESATRFLDCLVAASPELQQVIDGSLKPGDLRSTSMIGSITMMSVLAGVFHNLSKEGVSDKEIQEFFSRLVSRMGVPVSSSNASGKMWLSCGSEDTFTEGKDAPGARAQQVKELVTVITGWFSEPPMGL